MPAKAVASRAEAFAFVERIGSAALAGQPIPEMSEAAACMKADDMIDGVDAFSRKVAERLDALPAQVSDDLKIQELLRQHLDKAMSDLVVGIRAFAESMSRPD